MEWLEKADFEAKIVIGGNHDVTLDKPFHDEYGSCFHNQTPQSPEECLNLLTSSPAITYLNHSSATVELTKHPLLKVSLNIFGSPYSPRGGMWAFGYDKTCTHEVHGGSEQANTLAPTLSGPVAGELWSAIPLDTDIVVTHTPPYSHCDESTSKRRAMGCEDLRRALWRVRPRLAVCGHVHEGRGVERVRWDTLGTTGTPYAELGVDRWDDPGAAPGSRKLSLVDLTARGGWGRPLGNDGAPLRHGSPADRLAQSSSCRHFEDGCATALPGFGTRGVGGNPDVSVRCDRRALCCRMGRKETCVVNCAIAATSWPHQGGKRFNKPVVVDLDLPVIED